MKPSIFHGITFQILPLFPSLPPSLSFSFYVCKKGTEKKKSEVSLENMKKKTKFGYMFSTPPKHLYTTYYLQHIELYLLNKMEEKLVRKFMSGFDQTKTE